MNEALELSAWIRLLAGPLSRQLSEVLAFTRWVHFFNRWQLPLRQVGIYALARFEGSEPDALPANPLDVQTIYFGSGKKPNRMMEDRLDEFGKAAFKGYGPHSGGETYRAVYGDDGRYLYVAVCPVSINDATLRAAARLFGERSLILLYYSLHGRMTTCNKE